MSRELHIGHKLHLLGLLLLIDEHDYEELHASLLVIAQVCLALGKPEKSVVLLSIIVHHRTSAPDAKRSAMELLSVLEVEPILQNYDDVDLLRSVLSDVLEVPL